MLCLKKKFKHFERLVKLELQCKRKMEDQNRTELKDLGEFGLIELIKKKVQIRNASTLTGIGDDAAVIKYDDDSKTVISTDFLVEGVHFDLSYVPLKHLGYKAVMVNISDIIAMNAVPRQITVSLSLSNRFSLEAIEEIYEGIFLACELYNVDLIGGDTTSSVSGMTISVTAIGEGKEGKIVYRNGAKESNLLVVSGDLGGAYMGLQILEREKQIYKESPGVQPDLSDCDYILERQLKPEARLDVVREFESLGIKPNAMMDISDGLYIDLKRLAASSKKHAVLDIDLLQNHLTSEVSVHTALEGGEDYGLLVTIAKESFEELFHRFMKSFDYKLKLIGYITNGDGISFKQGKETVEVTVNHFTHFGER